MDAEAAAQPAAALVLTTLATLLLTALWWLWLRRASSGGSDPPFSTPLRPPPLPLGTLATPSPPPTRHIYRCAVRTQLREGAGLGSAERGVLDAGQLAVGLEETLEPPDSSGRRRVRVARLSEALEGDAAPGIGWLSAAAAGGEPILVPLPPVEAAAAWRWRALRLMRDTGGGVAARRDAVAAFGRVFAASSSSPACVADALTTSAKLRHDADQLEWLETAVWSNGAARSSVAAAVAALRATERSLFSDGQVEENGVALMTAATVAALRGWSTAPIHVAPSDAIPGGALGTADWSQALARYRETAPGVVIVDDFLCAEALRSLVHYCRASTIFGDFMYLLRATRVS